jgi:hypothetical protein
MTPYVYAFVDRKLPRLRLRGHVIDTVPIGDLHAAVEMVGRAPAVSEQALCEQHEIVLALAGRVAAILPARFGSLVDREELENIVARRHPQFTAALRLVRGREQMTVRLVGDAGAAEAPPRRQVTAVGGPGARYLQQRRAAAGYPLPGAVERLNAAVRALVVADKAEPGQGAVRAMLYHLIERGSSASYCRALAAASSHVVPFRVKVTGPWPPFAFAPEVIG